MLRDYDLAVRIRFLRDFSGKTEIISGAGAEEAPAGWLAAGAGARCSS